MKLGQLLQSFHIEETNPSIEQIGDMEISGIASDSRRVKNGGIFVCLRGMRTDGHDYIVQAVNNGAAVVVIEAGADCAIPLGTVSITVKSTRKALAYLWDAWYDHPGRRLHIIAITGTNGKTSTAYMLRSILMTSGYKTGLIGTVRCLIGNNEIDLGGGSEIADMASAMTTPDPEYLYQILHEMAERGAEYVVMEASSHALAQEKLAGLAFDLAVFTNLSSEHLDFHGTMNAYFAAKAKLFRQTSKAVVNIDDPWSAQLIQENPQCHFVTCSARAESVVDEHIDYSAVNCHSLGADGVEYILYSRRAVFRVRSQIPGDFTVYNTMLAVAAAIALGIDIIMIQEAIRNLGGVDGRIERVRIDQTKKNIAVFIDYAHTPLALESVLETMRGFCRKGQRITVLFGCGGDRDKSKRRAMGAIASRLADMTVVTSDNCRTEDPMMIIHDILRGVDKEKPYQVIPDRREAIAYAVRETKAGDILLLVGKGHERYEIDATGKHPFDEREIVREAVDRLADKTERKSE